MEGMDLLYLKTTGNDWGIWIRSLVGSSWTTFEKSHFSSDFDFVHGPPHFSFMLGSWASIFGVQIALIWDYLHTEIGWWETTEAKDIGEIFWIPGTPKWILSKMRRMRNLLSGCFENFIPATMPKVLLTHPCIWKYNFTFKAGICPHDKFQILYFGAEYEVIEA